MNWNQFAKCRELVLVKGEAWYNGEDYRASHGDVGSNFGSALSFCQKWRRQYLPHKAVVRIKVNEKNLYEPLGPP